MMRKNNTNMTEVKKMKKEKKIKSAELKLHKLLDSTIEELSKGIVKPITDEDIRNAKFEIVEEEIAEIIHQAEITINSQDGKQLIVTVYLDENFDWYFKRESLNPWFGNNPPKSCLKIVQTNNVIPNRKLIACYPVEDFISDFFENANKILHAEMKILQKEKRNREVKV